MSLFGRPAKENKAPAEQQSSSFGTRTAAKGKEEDLSSSPKSQSSSRIEMKKPLSPQKPSTPPKPKTLFEEKKDWTRTEFQKKVAQAPYKCGGKIYSSWERKKMINETFPSRRFSTYVSKGETKTRLRELRNEEYRAKTYAEKSKLAGMRKYLEGQTGLKGKY